jgi:hypothetical protein
MDRVHRGQPTTSDDLDFIKHQLARPPTRSEVWCAAVLRVIGSAVAAVTLIEAFERARN